MSLLSSYFKGSKKVNLTPDIRPQMPSETNPLAYNNMSSIANRYINNIGTGYGDSYVDKNVNPVAEAARRNFRQFTAPQTASAFSSRGLGRSSLAANELGRQEGDVESNVNQIMAQFYNLNEQAKKADVNTGINLSQNLLSGDVAQHNVMAEDSRQLANATASDARTRETNDNAKVKQIISTVLGAATGGATGGFSGAMTGASTGLNSAQPGATTSILGQTDSKQLSGMDIAKLLALLGG